MLNTNKFIFLVFCLLLMILFFNVQAQNIFFKELNGNQTSELIDDIQNLKITNGVLEINTKTDNKSYTIGNLRYLGFKDYSFSTNVQQISNSELIIYPNPADDQLMINTPDYIRGRFLIGLFAADGRKTKTFSGATETKARIDISDLQSGMYFLIFISGKYTISQPFIKK